MNVIDLFSGAGGLSEGFAQNGFHTIVFIEKEYWACQTLETRLCFHWLKQMNMLKDYHAYCRASKSYLDCKKTRHEHIYKKVTELERYASSAIINRAFGMEQNNPATIDGQTAIRMIEDSMKAQGINTIDVVVGGPPCQAYSIIGRSRMGEAARVDIRNYLFRYYLNIVSHFQPSMFVFENVPGLLSAQDGKLIHLIRDEFKSIGYTLLWGSKNDVPDIHRISEFGVNQKRCRLILVGYRNKQWKEPVYPDFAKYAKPLDEPQTTCNTIGDLPILKAGQGNDLWYADYTNQPISEYGKVMRTDSEGVQNHFARPHRSDDLEIYERAQALSALGEKLSYSSLPEHLKHHKNADTHKFKDRFCVHGLNEMPHTIVAHLSKDGHYNIHPTQIRSITVREAARIQGFPDNYRFEGPRTAQFLQVGNAVPPMFSNAIAAAVHDLLINRGEQNNG